jgi:putative ABC transport system substrate-binding protein
MRRRDLIVMLGSVACWSLVVRAEEVDRVRRVGALFHYPATDPVSQSQAATLEQELQRLGWTAGRNILLEYRYSPEPNAASELLALSPDVLIANSTPTLQILRQATQTVPLIFVGISDPVGQGFVSSLAHPGGNITGFAGIEFSIGAKWIQALKEIAPSLTRVAVIYNPTTAPYYASYLESVRAAAGPITVIAMPVHDLTEMESALASFAQEPDSGIVSLTDAFTYRHREAVVSTMARFRLPAIYAWPVFRAKRRRTDVIRTR